MKDFFPIELCKDDHIYITVASAKEESNNARNWQH